MSAPTPAGPDPAGSGLQRPGVGRSGFGRPSPELLARADRGYARFLADTAWAPGGKADGRDDTARQR
ncbi:hypothetical protein ACFYT5_38715 [Streptomyces anulatus]|uniref:hypothetical protein n=1 Tax=Streptomyces anulatus TaxID=1892 RepID=UPI00367ACB63